MSRNPYQMDDYEIEEILRDESRDMVIGVGIVVGAFVGALLGLMIDNFNLGIVLGGVGGFVLGRAVALIAA